MIIMKTEIESLQQKLLNLFLKTKQTENQFQKAAVLVKNQSLKSYFLLKSKERHDFYNELKKTLKIDGRNSLLNLHIDDVSWIDVEALFFENDEDFLLEGVVEGEKLAIKDYKNLIKEAGLTLDVRSLLITQKSRLENGLSSIQIPERKT